MSKGTFTLAPEFEKNLDHQELLAVIAKYKQSLKDFPPPTLDSKGTYSLIASLKRSPHRFGPYKGLTLFEIANRLFSDLVLMEGAKHIFEKPSLVTQHDILSMKLNPSNISGYDLEIYTEEETIYGEAYNTAPSFFKIKTASTLRKLNHEKHSQVKKAVLLFNEDALDENGNRQYIENKKNNQDILINYIPLNLNDWKNI